MKTNIIFKDGSISWADEAGAEVASLTHVGKKYAVKIALDVVGKNKAEIPDTRLDIAVRWTTDKLNKYKVKLPAEPKVRKPRKAKAQATGAAPRTRRRKSATAADVLPAPEAAATAVDVTPAPTANIAQPVPPAAKATV
jgi:hypothetical protein